MSARRKIDAIDSSCLFVDDADSTKRMRLELDNITSSSTRVITILDSDLTMVGEATTQTLTNKTLDVNNNTISNIDNTNIKSGAGIDASKIADGSISNIEFQYLNGVTSSIQSQIDNHASSTSTHGVSGDIVGTSDSQILTNKTFTDNVTYFQDNTDNTKKLQLQLSGITTGTTRTLNVPDANTTIVGTNTNQTLTNKTVDGDLNTISNIDNNSIKSGANIDALKIGDGIISNTEFGYLDGLTDNIQTQINNHASLTTTHGVSGDIVGTTDTQVLTNKTFTDDNTYFQDNLDNTKKLKLQLSGITTGTTRILTVPNADTTLVGTALTQTLTNKTVDADSNTIINVDDNNIKSAAGINATKIADGSISNTEFQKLNGILSNVVGVSDTQTLTNKTLTDTSTFIQNNSDNTKKIQFQLSPLTTGMTRIITIPDFNLTLVGTSSNQSLTNKTINAETNTITNIANSNIKTGAAIDATKIADGTISNSEFEKLNGVTSQVVGISDTQTLTNKTVDADNNTITNIDDNDIKASAGINANKIADGSIGNSEFQNLNGLSSLAVGISDAQTLTNKTINADNNIITNIDDGNIKTGAAIDATKIANGSITNAEFQQLNGIGSLAVGISDSQTLTNKTFGNNLNMSNNKIINAGTPTNDADVATKGYVDEVASGLDAKQSVKLATTVDLDSNSSISGGATYNSTGGSSSRGQITATLAVSDTFTVDGVNLSSADDGTRILIKSQTNGDENGIYVTTVSGTSLTLDRATDFDEDDEVSSGAFIFIEEGSTHDNSGWILSTNNPITIGGASGTSLEFVQFSGAGQITAGDGMTKSGNVLNVVGSSTIIANADSIEVNSSTTANQILISTGTVGNASTFGALPLGDSNSVTGVLSIANGGTNTSSFSNPTRIIATNSGNTALETTNLDPSTVVTTTGSQTITNKTINATNNTITNIANSHLKSGAAIDATKIADGSVSNARFQYLNSLTGNIQTQLDEKIPYSETNLIDLENGSPGDINHAKFLITKSHGGSDDYNLGIDSDPVKFILSAEDGTYRQATIFSADNASTTATIFGIASSNNSGTNWYPRLVVCQDGKVGIGTNSPSNELSVTGNISVSGTVDGRDIASDGTTLDNHLLATTAHGVSGSLVGTTDTQTLTNKTFTDSTTSFQDDVDNTKKMQFQLSGITTGTTRILTVPNETTTLVGTDATQTLTNKFIDADNNTLSNIDNDDIKNGAAIDASKIANGSITNTEFQYLNGVTSNIQTQIDNHTGDTNNPHSVTKSQVGLGDVPNIKMKLDGNGNPTVSDDSSEGYSIGSRWLNITLDKEFVCFDNTDGAAVWLDTTQQDTGESNTASNIGTGGVGIYKTKVGENLQFKKLNAGSSKISITDDTGNDEVDVDVVSANINIGDLNNAPAGTVVGTTDSQYLSNKSFYDNSTYFVDQLDTSKKAQFELGGITASNTRVLTVPDADLTIVGHNTTQTLTNKTIDANSNTIVNLDNSTIKSGAAIDALKIGSGTVNNTEFGYLDGVTSSIQTQIDNHASSSSVHGVSGSVVGTGNTQTLTNKTFTDNTTYFQDDSDNTKKLQFQLSGITTATTRTLTIPNANTTIAGTDISQTLTNKTIDANNNTIINIGNADIKTAAGIDASKIADGSVSNTEYQYLNGVTSSIQNQIDAHTSATSAHGISGTFVGTTDAQTLTNKTFTDSATYFQDDVDNTKKLKFELSGITTGTTRTLTIPDGNITLVGTIMAQTLVNKTFTDDKTYFQNNSDNTKKLRFELSNVATGTTRTLTIPDADITIMGINNVQTLTNKTFVDNSTYFEDNVDSTKKLQIELSSISTGNTRTLTVPDADTTIMGTNIAQTMINKTIDANNNTISNIADGNIKASAAINASKIADGTISNTEFQYLNGTTSNIQTQINNHTSNTNNPHVVTKTQIGLANVENLKIKLDATTAPTINNDTSEGYVVGSRWIDITNDKEYVCLDNTDGSAVWIETTSIGGSGEVNLASNIGTEGVGIYKDKTDVTLNFKKLNAGSNKVTITDDVANDEIDVDIMESNIAIGNLNGAPTGTVVGTTDTQTLTNKTFTDNTTYFQDNGDNTKKLQLELSNISTSTTRTLTVPDANTTITGVDISQTLTNKTIDADNNTISNIDNTNIKTAAAIDSTKIADGSVSNTEFQYLNGVTSSIQTQINNHLSDTSTHGISGAIVGTTDIQTLTNKTWGDNLDMNSNKILNLGTPTTDNDAVNKAYVDSVASGLDIKQSVKVATTVDLDSNSSISGSITYSNISGPSGRGQITATLSVSDTFTVDGVSLSSSDDGSRILIKNQSSGAQNGIYTTTISGTSLTLDRASDFDQDNEVTSGAFMFIEEGTTNMDTSWVLTTNDPIIIGGLLGTSLTFSKFTSTADIIAGSGLSKTDNTLNINTKANGGIIIETDNLALDLDASSITGTLSVTNGGTGATTFTSGNFLQGNGSSAITAIKSIPSGDVIGTTDSQTLTNKTIDADNNTLSNIVNGNIKAGAGIDATKIADGTISNTEFQYLNGVSSNIQTQINNHTGNSSNPHSVTKSQIGLADVENLKVKLDATTAPTVNNDTSEGYVVGSRWIDITNDKEYVCLDNTDGAAVWTETTIGDGEANTASNIGTGGVGIYKQKTGVDLEFKKINNGDGITITDDTGNNEIDVAMNINGLTIDSSPDGSADYIATYDASSSTHKKVLLNNLPLAYYNITSTTTTSTTSGTYVLMNSMTVTPASGTYIVTFSASGEHSIMSSDAQYAIFNDGTIVSVSERNFAWGGGLAIGVLALTMHTQAVITVNGSQAIEVRWHDGGSGTFTAFERSMILIKV